MRQATDEPSTSTGKWAGSTCYSVPQVVDTLQSSESDEGEFSKEYLSLSDSSDDFFDEALRESESESGDSENERLSGGSRGVPMALNQVEGEMQVPSSMRMDQEPCGDTCGSKLQGG